MFIPILQVRKSRPAALRVTLLMGMFAFEKNKVAGLELRVLLCHCWLGVCRDSGAPVFLNPVVGTWGLRLAFIATCLSSSSAQAAQRWMTSTPSPGNQERDQEQRVMLAHTG